MSGVCPKTQHLKMWTREFAELVGAVNDYIETEKPIFSWYPGKYRTSLKDKDLT
jgi:hypothetical protein